MMSFQLGRPSGLATLDMRAAAFTFEAGFLEVVLEAGLLIEVRRTGESDATDMDDNNVANTVQSKRTYIRSSTCLSVAVLIFILC